MSGPQLSSNQKGREGGSSEKGFAESRDDSVVDLGALDRLTHQEFLIEESFHLTTFTLRKPLALDGLLARAALEENLQESLALELAEGLSLEQCRDLMTDALEPFLSQESKLELLRERLSILAAVHVAVETAATAGSAKRGGQAELRVQRVLSEGETAREETSGLHTDIVHGSSDGIALFANLYGPGALVEARARGQYHEMEPGHLGFVLVGWPHRPPFLANSGENVYRVGYVGTEFLFDDDDRTRTRSKEVFLETLEQYGLV